jgi:hypothetical protein
LNFYFFNNEKGECGGKDEDEIRNGDSFTGPGMAEASARAAGQYFRDS